jgi:membrane-associated phospholipid phosphatase
MSDTTPANFSRYIGSLPLVINDGNKIAYGLILAAVTAFLYLTSNHIHLFEPHYLPMTWVDRTVPFIPETVWIYTSEYYLFVVVYLTLKNRENINRYVYAFLFQQVISIAIFWLWPTTYPRELFPLPDTLDPASHLVFTVLRIGDSPANCCPSLHVSSVYLSSFMFLKEQRTKFPFFFLWATAVALTTLTTKQHYIVDVVTGLVSAVMIYLLFATRLGYREPAGLQANR